MPSIDPKKGGLLELRGLSVDFLTRAGRVSAVDRVDLDVACGSTIVLAGESGCGKSVTALALADLLGPTSSTAFDRMCFLGGVIDDCSVAASRAALRGHGLAYIFQDPQGTFNPVFTVGSQIREALRALPAGHSPDTEVLRLLHTAGLPDGQRVSRMYPHELSGGMLQRVSIAMALACRPSLLVADEPTTALDVTVQAQIMDLLKSIQRETAMGMILITHNLALAAGIGETVNIMYLGQIVERGPMRAVLDNPLHPYTRGLIKAIPRLKQEDVRLVPIAGSVPSAGAKVEGCRFASRCPKVATRCRGESPADEVVDGERMVRCHYWR